MKKKKLLVMIAMLFTIVLLTACGSSRETTTTCVFDSLDFHGDIIPGHTEFEFEAVGDSIKLRREKLVIDLGEEIYIDELVQLIEQEIEFLLLIAVDGITSEITDVTDSTVTWVTTTDFEAMSEEDLETYLQDYHFFSLELLVENMEEEGATCTVVYTD